MFFHSIPFFFAFFMRLRHFTSGSGVKQENAEINPFRIR